MAAGTVTGMQAGLHLKATRKIEEQWDSMKTIEEKDKALKQYDRWSQKDEKIPRDQHYLQFFKRRGIIIDRKFPFKKSDTSNSNHLTVNQAAIIGKKSNAKQVVLTHFWPEYTKEQYLQDINENISVDCAKTGQIYNY